MNRPLARPARPAMFLLTLLITVACTSAPVAAQTPTGPTGVTATAPSGTSTPPQRGPATPGTDPGGSVGGNPGSGGGNAGGGSGGTEPGGGSVGGGGGVVDPNPLDPDAGWKTVKPEPGLRELHPESWDHVQVSPDGKTLTVYFWSGVDSCFGLADVQVSQTAGVTTITLIIGTRLAPNMACNAMAQAFKTIVTLPQPIILDGSRTTQP